MTRAADAVFFAPEDYAPIPRRLAALLIDILAILLLYAAVYMVTAVIVLPREVHEMPRSPEKTRVMTEHLRPYARRMSWTWLVLVAAYHILLRATRGGTAGYRAARIRLVDPTGRPPPLKVLLKRFLIAVPGCLLLGIAYLKCRGSPRRQAAHDQWAGTWVVRRRAAPAGPARVVYQTTLLGTFLLTHLDVEPLDDSAGADAEDEAA